LVQLVGDLLRRHAALVHLPDSLEDVRALVERRATSLPVLGTPVGGASVCPVGEPLAGPPVERDQGAGHPPALGRRRVEAEVERAAPEAIGGCRRWYRHLGGWILCGRLDRRRGLARGGAGRVRIAGELVAGDRGDATAPPAMEVSKRRRGGRGEQDDDQQD